MMPRFDISDLEVYLDNAATTRMCQEVVDKMLPFFTEEYANPETVYRMGRRAKEAVERSRRIICDIMRCNPGELFFTSGGTESNNWAIKGAIRDSRRSGIITSTVEHLSVLEAVRWASRDVPHFEVPVDGFGSVDLAALDAELRTGKYFLVSIQYANNEIGTIQPVAEIASLCKKYGAVFHCDAVQAFGKVKFDVDDVGADMITLSAHKIHGPMGIGALYIKEGTKIEPLLHGGGQESGMRSGTMAVPEIVGFGKAAEMAAESIATQGPRMMAITEWMASQLCLSLKAKRNGHPTRRLPNIVSVTVPNMEADLVCGIMCSKYGTCISSGAACSTTKRKSRVLAAIGGKEEDAASTLRISMSRFTKDEDMMVAFGRLQSAWRESVDKELT